MKGLEMVLDFATQANSAAIPFCSTDCMNKSTRLGLAFVVLSCKSPGLRALVLPSLKVMEIYACSRTHQRRMPRNDLTAVAIALNSEEISQTGSPQKKLGRRTWTLGQKLPQIGDPKMRSGFQHLFRAMGFAPSAAAEGSFESVMCEMPPAPRPLWGALGVSQNYSTLHSIDQDALFSLSLVLPLLGGPRLGRLGSPFRAANFCTSSRIFASTLSEQKRRCFGSASSGARSSTTQIPRSFAQQLVGSSRRQWVRSPCCVRGKNFFFCLSYSATSFVLFRFRELCMHTYFNLMWLPACKAFKSLCSWDNQSLPEYACPLSRNDPTPGSVSQQLQGGGSQWRVSSFCFLYT